MLIGGREGGLSGAKNGKGKTVNKAFAVSSHFLMSSAEVTTREHRVYVFSSGPFA